MATKRVKFLKPWQMTPAGAEMELDAPVAELLIIRGRAEEIKEAPAALPPKTLKIDPKALKRALKKARLNNSK